MGKVIGSILVGDSDFFLCPTFVITVLNLNLNSFSLGKSAQAGKGAMRLTLYKYIYILSMKWTRTGKGEWKELSKTRYFIISTLFNYFP